MRPQRNDFQWFRNRTNPAYTLSPSGKSSVSRKVVLAKQLSLIRSPDALNYCEKARLGSTMAATFVELELAYQRRRVAEQLRAGRDTRLSMLVLATFQETQQLLLEHRTI